MKTTFGERLKTVRIKHGLNQTELADKMSVSRQAISKWERNSGLPDLYNIEKLSTILDVDMNYLIKGEEQKMNTHNKTNFSNRQSKNFIKNLLYKAKHTSNSAQAKKIKNWLLIGGGAGVLVGLIMVITGFLGFVNGGMDSVNNVGQMPSFPSGDLFSGFDDVTIQEPEPFNPLKHMAVFMGGGLIASISVYALYAGLAITVANVTTNFLDDRKKCPKCKDEIDSDELVCSNCGHNLQKTRELLCACGKSNKPTDNFCRSCGQKLERVTATL